MDYIFVYTTAKDETEADRIAKHAVNQRVAACANIIPKMKSYYYWKGNVQSDAECVVVFKTTSALFSKLEAAIIEKHSYECPCIISLPIQAAHVPYLKWISSNVD